ncbi:MAG: hypothetical protein E7589_07345 [Ruminococcaceae bacterium]|nr:hypothetical protein [Oscillospiraceae bacterium]
MTKLEQLRKLIFESDNSAAFIERDRILTRLEAEMADYTSGDRYAVILAKLLAEVSTPVLDCDYFAGRMVEGLPEEGVCSPSRLLFSTGHMNPDYAKLLKVGLGGILDEIKSNAAKINTTDALEFAHNAEIVVMAVRNLAARYSAEAERVGNAEMAAALARVPFEPAYDFYSALQSIWLVNLVASCYVGSRDYAFGRFDEYMLPYYRQALKAGKTADELDELLAGFFMKTNEICGRATHNYNIKPILPQASKQYVNIGGEHPNELSRAVLRAAIINNMAQPQITVLLSPSADADFNHAVFTALEALTDKMNIYNYDLVVRALINKGVEPSVAKNHTYSACCTFDFNYHSFRREYFAAAPQMFLEVIKSGSYESVDGILADFRSKLREGMQRYADLEQKRIGGHRQAFVFDCLLLSDSAVACKYPDSGVSPYNALNYFCPGVATIGDSLMVLDKLVFKNKRISYAEFMNILENNFEGHEELRGEILAMTHFGNDSDADGYTALVGNTFLDAVDELTLKDNFFAIGGFYSLERDNVWASGIGATPDGRLAGQPFSENQSPTYGMDKSGITALLHSISKLPFDRAATGGLNLTFGQRQSPEILEALVLSYFKMGGFHVGISVLNREELKDAMAHPEKYPTLTVRLYGFSEYFISLPEWQQLAVINRTAY